jgi:hypothetical protein
MTGGAAPESRQPGRPDRRRRAGWIIGLVVIASAIALAAAFRLSQADGGSTVADAAALHELDAETGAPGVRSRTLLTAEVSGVPFPRYPVAFGWLPTGRRSDIVDGRRAVTVFYASGGRRIGYTILEGAAVSPPQDAKTTPVEETRVAAFDRAGRTILTWRRRGRTCVMSAVEVPFVELARLATWRGGGTVPF